MNIDYMPDTDTPDRTNAPDMPDMNYWDRTDNDTDGHDTDDDMSTINAHTMSAALTRLVLPAYVSRNETRRMVVFGHTGRDGGPIVELTKYRDGDAWTIDRWTADGRHPAEYVAVRPVVFDSDHAAAWYVSLVGHGAVAVSLETCSIFATE